MPKINKYLLKVFTIYKDSESLIVFCLKYRLKFLLRTMIIIRFGN
jgi:hypothetical protein